MPIHGTAQRNYTWGASATFSGMTRRPPTRWPTVLSLYQQSNILYLAELLMGSIHETAGRGERARESFERAAALQPRAQSPLVALSHLAREAGNRSEAVRYIDRLAALPPPTDGRNDPWWHYQSAAVADHAALLNTLRAAVRARRRP